MEKKEMYALTYTYEGYYGNSPYGGIIAVSYDKKLLNAKMKEMVAIDCREPEDEDEEYSDECNWKVTSEYDDYTTLRHKANTDLYSNYRITYVEVLS